MRLSVCPIGALGGNEPLVLIVLNQPENTHVAPPEIGVQPDANPAATQRIVELENQVTVTREALQQTIEQLETSNWELQSINEELQSSKEELQAGNEEMETSNEELRSINEELIRVNEEFQITATELSGRTGELTSVPQSIPLAIMVTDNTLQITQTTKSAAELFGIKQPIASPHISQIVSPDGYPALAPICSKTLRLGAATEREFSSDGTRVSLSCNSYFDAHGRILGLTMVATQFPGLAREMELILRTSNIHFIPRKIDGEILWIAASSARSLGVSHHDAEGTNLFDYLPADIVDHVSVQDALILKGKGEGDVNTTPFVFNTDEAMTYLALKRHRFFAPATTDPSIYMIASDVTDVIKEPIRPAHCWRGSGICKPSPTTGTGSLNPTPATFLVCARI